MIFRKANSKDEDTIKQIASRAYQKYIERMGKEPAPMRPNIQKNDIVFVCEKENKIIAFAIRTTFAIGYCFTHFFNYYIVITRNPTSNSSNLQKITTLNNDVAQKSLSFTLLDFIWRKSSSFINTNEDMRLLHFK